MNLTSTITWVMWVHARLYEKRDAHLINQEADNKAVYVEKTRLHYP